MATTQAEDVIKRWALVVVLVGTFMTSLDVSVVTLSLPTLTDVFGTSIGTIEWVTLAYLLALTSLMIAFGRAADVVGAKTVYTLGLLVFTVGSALSGTSFSALELILFRVVQGVGGAMILATGQAILTEVFPERERGRAMGLMHVAVAAGLSAGPSLGGLLVEHVDWRAIFYVNVPVGLAIALIALRILPRRERQPAQAFDFPGAFVFAAALVALLFGVTRGQDEGWTSFPVLSALFVGLAFLVGFAVAEARAKQPLLEVSLFRSRGYSFGLAASFLTFIAMASNMFLIPFLLQDLLDYSPSRAGLVMITVPLTILWVAPLGGWSSYRMGSRLPATVGLALVTSSIFLMASLGLGSPVGLVVAVLVLYGVGAGLFQAPNNSAVMGAAPRDRLGVASGTLSTMRQLGQVFGVAVAGAVWVSRTAAYSSPGVTEQAALADGFRDAFIALALVGVLATVVSWARGRPLAEAREAVLAGDMAGGPSE